VALEGRIISSSLVKKILWELAFADWEFGWVRVE
jgi:hypothetical protein